ncbi:hypothetical protein QTV49_004652 [Vibrio vulnificus]|nr:hypothetical protein [Vibrio vulnificus]
MTPNLLVLVTRAPREAIAAAYPDHAILNDADIFQILNGETTLDGANIKFDDFQKLGAKLEEMGTKGKRILVHSFNPLLPNYLEAGQDVDGKFETDVIACEKRFLIYSGGDFMSLFTVPSILKKLSCMGLGDAICDTFVCDYIEGAQK